MLTEIKTNLIHYFHDEHGNRQGEYKDWHSNGQMYDHDYFVDDQRQGECKQWYENGQMSEHAIYCAGRARGEYKSWDDNGSVDRHDFRSDDSDFTNEVKALVKDINNITDEERLLIKIQWGIECLPR